MKWNGTCFEDAEDMLLPEGFARSGQPQGPPAVTEAVRNLGAEQAQSIIHTPHTLQLRTVKFTVTEASVAVPILSGCVLVNLAGPLVNYITVSPSACGQDVFVALGSTIQWVPSGGVFFPLADFVVRDSSIFMLIPARDNWEVQVLAWSNPLGSTSDAIRLGYGYIPQGRDRLMLE